jgi:hypothetical protein
MIAAMAEPSAAEPAPIELRAILAEGEAAIEGDLTLAISGEPVAFHVIAPGEPASLQALLPVFQGLSNEVARRAASKAIVGGRNISCRAGCGACCRQAVPVAEAEARMIAALVEAMPEPRLSTIRARFVAA